jgi:hypothetical protein
MPPDTDLPVDVSTMNAQQVGRAGEPYVAAETAGGVLTDEKESRTPLLRRKAGKP